MPNVSTDNAHMLPSGSARRSAGGASTPAWCPWRLGRKQRIMVFAPVAVRQILGPFLVAAQRRSPATGASCTPVSAQEDDGIARSMRGTQSLSSSLSASLRPDRRLPAAGTPRQPRFPDRASQHLLDDQAMT